MQHGKFLEVVGVAYWPTVASQGADLAFRDAERLVVPLKSGNADGGKEPWSWNSVR